MDEQFDQQQLTKKQRREQRRQEKLENRESSAKKKSTQKILTWVGTIGGLGLLIWGMIYLAQGNSNTAPTGSVDAIAATDHVRGETTAPAVLIEYGDFQCPACATYEPIVQRLSDEFGSQLAVAFRHYPLQTIHPNAEPASMAAEAAANQGAFWAYHDLLYDRQSDWSQLPNTRGTFEDYAEELGLDLDQFKADLNASDSRSKINADIASGDKAGVQGTPSFFLNGQALDNPRSYDDFRTLIEAVLPAATNDDAQE